MRMIEQLEGGARPAIQEGVCFRATASARC